MQAEVYKVEFVGTFEVASISCSRALAIEHANQLANEGQRAIVYAVGAQMIVYRNWTANAATSEGREWIARLNRAAGIVRQ